MSKKSTGAEGAAEVAAEATTLQRCDVSLQVLSQGYVCDNMFVTSVGKYSHIQVHASSCNDASDLHIGSSSRFRGAIDSGAVLSFG